MPLETRVVAMECRRRCGHTRLVICVCSAVSKQVAALFVDIKPFCTDPRATLVALAARHALPAVYQVREFAAAGGLLTYSTSLTDTNHLLGFYIGRMLKGTKPADLPVTQAMEFALHHQPQGDE